MSMHSNQFIAGVSFSEIFGEEEGSISLSRVEAFLNQVVRVASENADASPNQLVRVVHGNKITWMTQKQAAEFLEAENNPDIQRDVERALKGELKYIRQELEILLALALYTFRQFKETNAISQEDINRIEPSLRRRKQEINEGIIQTSETEALMREKRRRNPLLDEYEQIMGEFLNHRYTGDQRRAKELASKLSQKKKQYLLLARAIEPDVRTIYYQRLNLQKTKKRILNTQNELCASRKDALMIEMTDLNHSLEDIRREFIEAEQRGLGTAAGAIDHINQYDLTLKENELTNKAKELQALNQESAIIEKHEREVDGVIQHITENVLQDTEVKVNVKDTFKAPPKVIPVKKEEVPVDPEELKRSGMHIGKMKR